MSKKGFSMPVVLAVIVVPVVLLSLAIQINEKLGTEQQTRVIGGQAASIQEARQTQLQLQTTIPIALKNAAYQAHFDIAEQGATFQFGDCGQANGIALWNSPESWTGHSCIPTPSSIKDAYSRFLRIRLGAYLAAINFPEEGYYFLIQDDGVVTAIAISSMRTPITAGGEIGQLAFKPNARTSIPFNFNIYGHAADDAKQLLSNVFECQSEGFLPSACVERAMTLAQTPWTLTTSENSIYFFEVNTGYSFPKEANGIIQNEPVVIKFSLAIPDLLSGQQSFRPPLQPSPATIRSAT